MAQPPERMPMKFVHWGQVGELEIVFKSTTLKLFLEIILTPLSYKDTDSQRLFFNHATSLILDISFPGRKICGAVVLTYVEEVLTKPVHAPFGSKRKSTKPTGSASLPMDGMDGISKL